MQRIRAALGKRGEARQPGRSCNRQCADQHRAECPRNLFPQPTHLAHVLLATAGMDHRAGCQEQQASLVVNSLACRD